MSTHSNQPAPGPTGGTSPVLYDFESIVAVAGGDQDVVQSLVDGLIQSNRSDLAELDAVLEAQDLPGLAEAAHRLKGPAKVINSKLLVASCEALEEAARSGQLSVARGRALDLRELILKIEASLLARGNTSTPQ